MLFRAAKRERAVLSRWADVNLCESDNEGFDHLAMVCFMTGGNKLFQLNTMIAIDENQSNYRLQLPRVMKTMPQSPYPTAGSRSILTGRISSC